MKHVNHRVPWTGISSAALITLCAATAAAETPTLQVGGFVKLDVISSAYQDGDLEPGSSGRDFYVPGSIPIGGESESRDIDFHAKTSRINFKTTTQVDDQQIVGFLELDFVNTGGNERVVNAYQAQVRHAYFTYDKWLFGQTWSTFQNVSALPEALDFIGPSEGTVFVRQAQVRYTSGPFQLSMENPETTVIANGATSSAVTDDATVPDLVGRYTLSGSWGSLVVAGIVRELKYETVASDDSTTGYGLSLSGKFSLGAKDDLRFMVTGGSGLGRYVAINTIAGAVFDSEGELQAIDLLSGMLSYRHFWSDKWRSSLIFSALEADYDQGTVGGATTKSTQSAHFNLLYSPVAKITVGGEIMYATRELENTADGSMNRLQFSAKYDF